MGSSSDRHKIYFIFSLYLFLIIIPNTLRINHGGRGGKLKEQEVATSQTAQGKSAGSEEGKSGASGLEETEGEGKEQTSRFGGQPPCTHGVAGNLR